MKRNNRMTRGVVRGMAMALLGVAVGMMGCAQPKPREPLPVAPEVLAANGMEVLWQTRLILAEKTQLEQIWLCGDPSAATGQALVVGLGSDHRLYAVDARTGVRRWSVPVEPTYEKVWPPVLHKDTLWVATTTKLIGLRTVSGQKEKTIDLDFAVSGPPATNGTYCFIPDCRGYLKAVPLVPKTLAWHRWTEGAVTAGPVLDDSSVYFASQSGEIYASAQSRRQIAWEYQAEGPVTADLRLTKTGLVLVASLDYSVYAFVGASGRLLWQYEAAEPVRQPPYAYGNQVFILTEGQGLTALDAADGQPCWNLPDGRHVAAADSETVYVISRGDDLLAVSQADGQVQFGAPLRRDTLVAVDETESGIIYLATPAGQIMAAAKKQEP